MKKNRLVLIVFLAGLLLNFNSCKKEEDETELTENPTGDDSGNNGGSSNQTTDEFLYEASKTTTGFTWFKNTDALLPKSSGSGHPQPFLRTRYNATAAAFLDSNGVIQTGAVFSDGSLIVKELINSNNGIDRYAILYKKSDHPDADANGWVWGYINGDGSVAAAASNKGSACINCHTQTGNIDYMLMNKFYP